MGWKKIPSNAGKPLVRIESNENTTEYDFIPMYDSRYSPAKAPHQVISTTKTLDMWRDEVICEFEPGCSVFIFGAGHSFMTNYLNSLPNIGKVTACDIVESAGKDLDADIDFQVLDILQNPIPGTFDYIFSSHTIEHFTRDEIMNHLIDKCLAATRKAVVFITPYADIGWPGSPEHRVQPSEDDELAAKASRYKRLRPTGIELVLWFPGKLQGEQEDE